MSDKYLFPVEIEEKSFRLRNEYAWKRKDLQSVFEYCLKSDIAILGGEAWVIKRISELSPDEPYERNLDPKFRQDLTILSRTQTHVLYGIFPFKDGQSGVFSWSTRSRRIFDSWRNYVKRTIDESQEIIGRGDIEGQVIPKYSANIFHNLTFKTH